MGTPSHWHVYLHAEGWGEFVDPHTVKVSLAAGGERTLTAQTILIATGGRVVKAPIDGAVSALLCQQILPLCCFSTEFICHVLS